MKLRLALIVSAMMVTGFLVAGAPTATAHDCYSEPSALGCCIGAEGSLYQVAVCNTCDTTYHIVFGQHCLHPPPH